MARLDRDEDQENPGGSDGDYEDALPPPPSKRQRLKQLGSTIKHAPKHTLLRLDVANNGDEDVQMDADGTEIAGITDNPAFNTGKVFRQPNDGTQVTNKLQSAAHMLTHPRQHAKEKAASTMQPSHHPFLTREADRELLEAHTDLHESSQGDDSTGQESLNEQADKVNRLENDRSDLRDAWVTSRHVKRARVARPGNIPLPSAWDYQELDDTGQAVRFQWEKYIGHMLLYLSDDFSAAYVDESDSMSFKRGTLIHQAERFLLSTTHWQTWLLHVKKVYMWEDYWLTGRWLATFFLLLKTGYTFTFMYLTIVWIVVRNRYFPTTTMELRRSHERALDKGAQAHNLSELINRHGTDQWLDPLLDELGPIIQQQLGDLADYMEIMANFYKWSNPRATVHTLFFWLCCATVAGSTSADFSNRIVFWVAGFYFFFSRPIASRYPKYRHLVSIFRWIYWEIPTHAELAFQHLSQQAMANRTEAEAEGNRDKTTAESFRLPTEVPKSDCKVPTVVIDGEERSSEEHEQMSKLNPTSSDDPTSTTSDTTSHTTQTKECNESSREADESILSFRGRYQTHIGRLVVTSTGLRFDSSVPHSLLPRNGTHKNLLHRPYTSLLEMRKCKSVPSSRADKLRKKLMSGPPEALLITWLDGTTTRIEEIGKRDECFNTIIGFSGVRWQALQPLREDEDGVADFEAGGEGGKNHLGKTKSAIGELGKL